MTTGDRQAKWYNSLSGRPIRSILFLLGIIFFSILTVNSWQETKEFLSGVKWFLFLVAILLGIADHIVVSLVFQSFLKKYGMVVTYSSVGKMYFYGQMSKYIPGRFWNVLYQRSFVQIPGATGSLLFTNIELLAGFIIRNTAIAITLILAGLQVVLAVGVYLSGAVGFWLIGRSTFIVYSIRWIANKIKRPLGEKYQIAHKPESLYMFFLYLLATMTFLSSNFLMMYATFNFSVKESFPYIAFLSLAWVVGVITLVVPAGMGVRELVFVTLASMSGANHSLEALAAIAVVYRFWHILQEIGGMLCVPLLAQIRISRE